MELQNYIYIQVCNTAIVGRKIRAVHYSTEIHYVMLQKYITSTMRHNVYSTRHYINARDNFTEQQTILRNSRLLHRTTYYLAEQQVTSRNSTLFLGTIKVLIHLTGQCITRCNKKILDLKKLLKYNIERKELESQCIRLGDSSK